MSSATNHHSSQRDKHHHERSHLLGHTHDHSHHHSKQLGEDVPYYAPPRQRQRWGEEQILPHTDWGELFWDLFYVGAAYNLGVMLKDDTSWRGFFYFIACFGAISVSWMEKVTYDSRYSPEDNLFHRSLEIIHIFCLATVIQHIRTTEEMSHTYTYPTTFIFSLSLVVGELIHMKWYSDVKINVVGGPEAKHNSRADIARKLVSVTIYALSAFSAGFDYFVLSDLQAEQNQEGVNHVPIILVGVGFFVSLFYIYFELLVLIPRSGLPYTQLRVPVNLELTIHRLGEWIMLMLGESILSLCIVEQSNGTRYWITFYSGILSVTMLQYMYYRSQPMDADDYVMRRSSVAGVAFIIMLMLFSGMLIIVGCSYKCILHQYLDEEENDGQVDLDDARRINNMFCWSLAASFFTLDIMVVSHRGWKAHFNRLTVVRDGQRFFHKKAILVCILDLFLLVVTGTLSWWIEHDMQLMSVMGLVMIVLEVLLRTRGLRYFPVSKAAMATALEAYEC